MHEFLRLEGFHEVKVSYKSWAWVDRLIVNCRFAFFTRDFHPSILVHLLIVVERSCYMQIGRRTFPMWRHYFHAGGKYRFSINRWRVDKFFNAHLSKLCSQGRKRSFLLFSFFFSKLYKFTLSENSIHITQKFIVKISEYSSSSSYFFHSRSKQLLLVLETLDFFMTNNIQI